MTTTLCQAGTARLWLGWRKTFEPLRVLLLTGRVVESSPVHSVISARMLAIQVSTSHNTFDLRGFVVQVAGPFINLVLCM